MEIFARWIINECVCIYLAHVTNDVSCTMEMRTGKGLTIEIQISLWIFMVKRIEITAISRRNISRSRRLRGEGRGGVIISANYIVQKRKIIMYFNELTDKPMIIELIFRW